MSYCLSQRDRFAEVFARAAGASGRVTFCEFMRLALFDPECGYYTSPRKRVGRDRDTDFFTATSLGPLFGRLAAAAAVDLAARYRWQAGDLTFVEIGAEPSGGVLRGFGHGFREVVEFGVTDAGRLAERLAELGKAGPLVVFSNELFDAQPVARFIRRGNVWVEACVVPDGSGGYRWEDGDPASDWLVQIAPVGAPDGWILDVPNEARLLARNLASAPWSGVFLAFDYGMTWTAISCERPAGTLRSYREHRQHDDLLANPGEQDLTAHICWDWLEESLISAGFEQVRTDSQESFLVRRAGGILAEMSIQAGRNPLGPEARVVRELLHPARMGMKFQVLSGVR